MTQNQSEPQLADQARTALLEAVAKAAQGGHGENARQLAEAYSLLKMNAPSEARGTTVVRSPLDGRR